MKMLLEGERARADQLEEETKLFRKKVENFKGVELALRGQEGDQDEDGSSRKGQCACRMTPSKRDSA